MNYRLNVLNHLKNFTMFANLMPFQYHIPKLDEHIAAILISTRSGDWNQLDGS